MDWGWPCLARGINAPADGLFVWRIFLIRKPRRLFETRSARALLATRVAALPCAGMLNYSAPNTVERGPWRACNLWPRFLSRTTGGRRW
jgi:hypothetical protein